MDYNGLRVPDNCEIIDGVLYAPIVGANGTIRMTAREIYDKQQAAKNAPTQPVTTIEDRVTDIEAALAAMAYGGDAE